MAEHKSTQRKLRRLKASTVAGEQLWCAFGERLVAFFHLNCDKYLMLELELGSKTKGADEGATVRTAHLTRGVRFEDSLLPLARSSSTTYLDCTNDKARKAETNELVQESAERLRTAPAGSMLYQPVFELPASWYSQQAAAQLRAQGIEFTHFKPDFLRVEADETAQRPSAGDEKTASGGKPKTRQLFIIDAKSSRRMKLSHQVQVTLYAMFLEHIIAEMGITDLRIADEGGVWLPGSLEAERFPLFLIRPLLREFLLQTLPVIVDKGLAKAAWHLCAGVCNSCDYFQRCRRETIEQKTISNIPYLTKRDFRWLKRAIQSRDGPDDTKSKPEVDIEDLADFLSTTAPETAPAADAGASAAPRFSAGDVKTGVGATAPGTATARKLHRLLKARYRSRNDSDKQAASDKQSASPLVWASPFIDAFRAQSVQCLDAVSTMFPSSEDVAVFVTCQLDPMSSLPFAWALQAFDRSRARGRDPQEPVISSASCVPNARALYGHSASPSAAAAAAAAPESSPPEVTPAAYRQLRDAFVMSFGRLLTQLHPARQTLTKRAGVFDMLLSAVMESESLSADDDAKDVQVDVKTATTHRLGELAAACLLSIVQDASVLHARVLPDLVGMASDDSAGEDDAADAEQDVGSLSSMTWSAIQKFNKKKLTELLAKLGLSEDGTNDVLKERLRKHQLKREFVKRQLPLRDFESSAVQVLEERLQDATKSERDEASKRKAELFKPRVAVLLDAIRIHLALPVPAFYRLSDCVRWLAPQLKLGKPEASAGDEKKGGAAASADVSASSTPAAAATPGGPSVIATAGVDTEQYFYSGYDTEHVYWQWVHNGEERVQRVLGQKLAAANCLVQALRSTIDADMKRKIEQRELLGKLASDTMDVSADGEDDGDGGDEKAAPAKRSKSRGKYQPSPLEQVLLLPAAKFRLLSSVPLRHPMLAKLAFLAQLDALGDCEQLRTARAFASTWTPGSLQSAGSSGTVIKYMGRGKLAKDKSGKEGKETFEVFSVVTDGSGSGGRSGSSRLSADTFKLKSWLLADHSDEGRIAVLRYSDMMFHDKMFAPGLRSLSFADVAMLTRLPVTLVTVEEEAAAKAERKTQRGKQSKKEPEAGDEKKADDSAGDAAPESRDAEPEESQIGQTVLCRVASSLYGGVKLKIGQCYTLQRRFVNYTMLKVLTSLVHTDEQFRLSQAALDSKPPPLFVSLLEDPNAWGVQQPPDLEELLQLLENPEFGSKLRKVYEMTDSQEAVFTQCLRQRLQIVWGPPGSGKTHYLSLAILRMIHCNAVLNPDTGAARVAQPEKKKRGRPSKADSVARQAAAAEAKTVAAQSPNYRVMVTAFTNSAIDNLLLKLTKLQSAIPPADRAPCAINFAKLGAELPGALTAAGVVALDPTKPSEIAGFLYANPRCVISGTVWQLHKILPMSAAADATLFDLLVLDEGSQFPVAHAAIPLRGVEPTSGRIWLAGDHLQLAPISHHNYNPDAEAGGGTFAPSSGRPPVQVALHGSILDCMIRPSSPTGRDDAKQADKSRADVGPCTLKLLDNFRMNTELAAFAQKLYGTDYRPLTANRDERLPVDSADVERALYQVSQTDKGTPASSPSNTAALCKSLAAAPALSLLRLEVATAAVPLLRRTLPEHLVRIEARIVAQLVAAFGSAAKSEAKSGRPSEPHTVFVVTPHHAQRIAVTQELRGRGIAASGSDDAPSDKPVRAAVESKGDSKSEAKKLLVVVDTVEKMQGREASLVIVCYAFLDAEQVQNEMDFLFDRSRLNVATTRARHKLIVLVADPVLRPPLSALSSPASKAGYAFLKALYAHAEATGADQAYVIEERELSGVIPARAALALTAADGAAAPVKPFAEVDTELVAQMLDSQSTTDSEPDPLSPKAAVQVAVADLAQSMQNLSVQDSV